MSLVVWREDARDDIVRLARFIAGENPSAARRVAQELLTAGDSLALFPRRGRLGLIPGTRELVTRPPFVLVYQVNKAGLSHYYARET